MTGSSSSGVIGAGAVVIASVFWGSNFIVTKGYDMKDGMHFQFLLCTGIVLVAFGTLLWAEEKPRGKDFHEFPLPDYQATISTEGIVGGVVWALGNLLTVPIVNCIGVGLGLSIWGGTSMVLSFLISRREIFGLEPQDLNSEVAGYLGAFLGLCSLAVFSFVESDAKAGSSTNSSSDAQDYNNNNNGDGSNIQMAQVPLLDQQARAAEEGDGNVVVVDGEIENENENDNHVAEQGQNLIGEKSSPQKTRIYGIVMALIAGVFYGFQFVPLTIHDNQYPVPKGVSKMTHQIRFFFSQFVGIYLTSAASFMIYCIYKKNKPVLVDASALLPSVLSGIMWAFACMGSMIAVSELGLGIGSPLSTNGAFLVNATWSIFYFREVQGARNLKIFALAGMLNIISCTCLAVAKS